MLAKTFRALVLVGIVVCGSDGGGNSPGDGGGDSAGRAVGERFRAVSAAAITAAPIVAELQAVGDLAADLATPEIRDLGVAVGDEASATALIDGEPEPTLDAFADACHAEFPI